MALMFQRLARNFIKAGYFPTDEVSLTRILGALDIGGAHLRILDPCCGEGTAIAEVRNHLYECGADVASFGIEYDRERAWHAKSIGGTVIHADVNDVFATARSMGLLFLNPPYGNAVRDQAETGSGKRNERIETAFVKRTLGWLQFGGVLVLIVPHYAFDRELAATIARHFERVAVFTAPEPRFKQVVLFGVKRRSDVPVPELTADLEAVGRATYGGDGMPPLLPQDWPGAPYEVPAPKESAAFRFVAVKVDGQQLRAELEKFQASTLWPQFDALFQTSARPHRRPLKDLSRWHLALALAAGQVAGIVTSRDGRSLLIKGDTFKSKEATVERQERADGTFTETRILTDKFVPVITGIDFTTGPTFGDIVTIR
jgi:SAM-dependent methyltransferase